MISINMYNIKKNKQTKNTQKRDQNAQVVFFFVTLFFNFIYFRWIDFFK